MSQALIVFVGAWVCISCSAVIHEVVASDSCCQTQTDIDSHHCLPFDSQHQSDILKQHSGSKNSWTEVGGKFAFYFLLVAILKNAHLKHQGDSDLEVVALAGKCLWMTLQVNNILYGYRAFPPGGFQII